MDVEVKVGVAAGEGVMTKKVGELPTKVGLLTAVSDRREAGVEEDAAVFEVKTDEMDKGFMETWLITAKTIAMRTKTALRPKERQARATYSRRKRKFAKRRLACKARIPKK